MIRIRGSLVLALLIVLVPTGALANGEIKAFEYKDGERWMFRVTEEFGALSNSEALSGDYEAVFSAERFDFFSVNGEKKEQVSESQREILLQMFGQGSAYGGKHIVFPLKVGSSWSVPDYHFRVPGGKKGQWRSVKISVLAIETAEVEKKKIPNCYKIVRYDSGPVGNWTLTYWVDPGCKCVAKYTLETNSGMRTMWLK